MQCVDWSGKRRKKKLCSKPHRPKGRRACYNGPCKFLLLNYRLSVKMISIQMVKKGLRYCMCIKDKKINLLLAKLSSRK